jgi:hypothetical protein
VVGKDGTKEGRKKEKKKAGTKRRKERKIILRDFEGRIKFTITKFKTHFNPNVKIKKEVSDCRRIYSTLFYTEWGT